MSISSLNTNTLHIQQEDEVSSTTTSTLEEEPPSERLKHTTGQPTGEALAAPRSIARMSSVTDDFSHTGVDTRSTTGQNDSQHNSLTALLADSSSRPLTGSSNNPSVAAQTVHLACPSAGRGTGPSVNPAISSSNLSVDPTVAAQDISLAGPSTTPATGPSTTPVTGSSTTPATGASISPATGHPDGPDTGPLTGPLVDPSVTVPDIGPAPSYDRGLDTPGNEPKAGSWIGPSTGGPVDHLATPHEDHLSVSQLVCSTVN